MLKQICKKYGNPSIVSNILSYTYETKSTVNIKGLIKIALNTSKLDFDLIDI